MRKLIIAITLLSLSYGCGQTSITQTSTSTTQIPTPTTKIPTPTTQIPTPTTVLDDSRISSNWVSPLCNEDALTVKRLTHLPETSSENPWGALIHPAPEGDDFWIPPNPVPGKPGDIIWARYEGELDGGKAYLLLYNSENVCNEPRAVSAWIAVPSKAAPATGRPILSWGHETLGAADHCAPSRTGYMNQQGVSTMVTELLKKDFVVVASDYEGHGTPGMHPWAESAAQGKNLLDAARAAHNFGPGEANRKTFVTGFSIGGHAMSRANEIADVYAPDLEILGIAGMLAGVVNSDWVPELVMRSNIRGYMVLAAVVDEAVWGQELAPLENTLTDFAIGKIGVLEELCWPEALAYYRQFEPEQLFRFPHNPKFTNGVDPSVVDAIGQKVGVAPVIIIHPLDDSVIPPSAVIEYVEKVCELGQDILIDWQEDMPHSVAMFGYQETIDALFGFLDARLAGDPLETHCGNIPDLPGRGKATVESGMFCAGFANQEVAQIFFDANPKLGDGLDTNGDGTACGEQDDGGLKDCADGRFELEHRCGSGANASRSGCEDGQEKTGGQCNGILHTCGAFDSQPDAQNWMEANLDFKENVDTNGDGTACGEGDYGGLGNCGVPNTVMVMGWACSDNRNPDLGTTGGLPNGVFLGCSKFDSQESAQIWLGANSDFGQRVDTNGDGQACTREDFGGLIDCYGNTTVLSHKCLSPNDSDETS